MIFHLVLNSLLVFMVIALAIEFTLWMLKIQSPRVRVMCRALPFLKIPFDFLVFVFFDDSLLLNFNPFSCELFVQEWLGQFLAMVDTRQLTAIQHVVIPQYIAMQLPPYLLHAVVIAIVTVSCLGLLYKLFNLVQSQLHLRAMNRAASPCTRYPANEQLCHSLRRHKATILVSSHAQVPLATYNGLIIIPETLVNTLSQEEFDAVIAHELEHLRWHDPLLKLFYSIMGTLCWWIPTHWWLKKLELDQEYASDLSIGRYGIDASALAAAVLTTLKQIPVKQQPIAATCQFAARNQLHLQRIEAILSGNHEYSHVRAWLCAVLCALTFTSFWMC